MLIMKLQRIHLLLWTLVQFFWPNANFAILAQANSYRVMQQQSSHQNNNRPTANEPSAQTLWIDVVPQSNGSIALNFTDKNIHQTSTTPYPSTIGHRISKILNESFENYDKRVRPNYGGPPVDVNVTMHIISISSVSEINMDFTADFYFRQTWRDPRLRFQRTPEIQTLFVGAEVSKKMWIPDTFFGNEKMAYFHEATTPNVFVRIDHAGEVYRSIRLTVTSSCAMRLQYFPMDRQQCTIEVESYGYNVRDIIYHWKGSNAVERDKTISLPQFDVIKTEQKTRTEELTSGSYSRLVAEIHFSRRMGYYLIQIYIPSSLIVVISWVSFWLHRNASPARVQLGVTTVLTMTTLMSSTNAALPKISYVKSIDIFLGTCFLMVFAALLEYATVGYLGKRIAMRKAKASALFSQSLAMTQHLLAAKTNSGGAAAGLNTNQQQPANLSSVGQNSVAKINLSKSDNKSQQDQLAAAAAHLMQLHNNQQQQNVLSQQQQDHLGLYDQNNHTAGQVSPSNFIDPTDHNGLYGGELIDNHGAAAATGSGALMQPMQLMSHPLAGHNGPMPPYPPNQVGPNSCLFVPPIAAEQIHKNYHQSSDNLTSSYFSGNHPYQHHHKSCLGHHHHNQHPSHNPFRSFYHSQTHLNKRGKMNSIFGIRPSDVDKYSRVVFPVCFICFQLMYWIVYLHISAFLEEETPNR